MYHEIIKEVKKLPKFEGSHCPNAEDHEYIVRKDEGRYVRIKDVLELIENKNKGD